MTSSPAEATTDLHVPDASFTAADRRWVRAWPESFSLHAGVVIVDHDREALERLARYGARPAFAHDRLT